MDCGALQADHSFHFDLHTYTNRWKQGECLSGSPGLYEGAGLKAYDHVGENPRHHYHR